eukprot:6205178-Pleurochrysis_carterae.AAC.1
MMLTCSQLLLDSGRFLASVCRGLLAGGVGGRFGLHCSRFYAWLQMDSGEQHIGTMARAGAAQTLRRGGWAHWGSAAKGTVMVRDGAGCSEML